MTEYISEGTGPAYPCADCGESAGFPPHYSGENEEGVPFYLCAADAGPYLTPDNPRDWRAEHEAAFGDEHDPDCPLCGVDAQRSQPRGSRYYLSNSDFDREALLDLPADAFICHEDEGLTHVEYPTGYTAIVFERGNVLHVYGPYLNRVEAEAEQAEHILNHEGDPDISVRVLPMYDGWSGPTGEVVR